jgi:glycosyltransferase involved in cell wall biosynthesis
LRVAVVIPAYQAAATIGEVVSQTLGVLPDANLIVVDDGSADGTGEAGRGKGTTVVTHPRNRGKGAALRTGIARARADGAEVIVTIDADGQHPAAEIPRLVQPIAAGAADLVLGARARNGAMPVSRRLTNWLSASVASRIGRQAIRDAQTGFRAFTRALAERVQPAGDRYEFEANFLLEALRAGYRVTSVEVPTIYGAPSHFRYFGDTWRMVRAFAQQLGLRD